MCEPYCGLRRACARPAYFFVNSLSDIKRRDSFAVASRKSDEVEWWIDVDQIKSTPTILDHSLDCRGSRVGCEMHATRVPPAVEAAVSAAMIEISQAARLPLQEKDCAGESTGVKRAVNA
jgi:hypothetical protein